MWAALLGGLCGVACVAQTPAVPSATVKPAHTIKRTARTEQPVLDPNVIVLDPAHGGVDPGATLGEDTLEKTVMLDFANRLKAALAAKDFTVVMTRSSDPVTRVSVPATPVENPDGSPAPETPAPPPKPAELTGEQRAETANRSRAGACLLLHATAAGHGVHLYTSALTPPPPSSGGSAEPRPIQQWDTAQTALLGQSARLAGDLATALNGNRIPLVTGHVSVAPIDSLTCPAVAVEVAPLGTTGPADEGYQQRVAESLTAALSVWRDRMQRAQAAAKAAQTSTPPARKERQTAAPGPAHPDAVRPQPLVPMIHKPAQPATPPDGGAR